MRILLFLLFCESAWASESQYVTNIIRYPEYFRFIAASNYVYDSRAEPFYDLFGTCVSVQTNGIVLQTIHRYTYRTVQGNRVFIQNFPMVPPPTSGGEQSGRAMRRGVISIDGELLDWWDYGTAYEQKVIKRQVPEPAHDVLIRGLTNQMSQSGVDANLIICTSTNDACWRVVQRGNLFEAQYRPTLPGGQYGEWRNASDKLWTTREAADSLITKSRALILDAAKSVNGN